MGSIKKERDKLDNLLANEKISYEEFEVRLEKLEEKTSSLESKENRGKKSFNIQKIVKILGLIFSLFGLYVYFGWSTTYLIGFFEYVHSNQLLLHDGQFQSTFYRRISKHNSGNHYDFNYPLYGCFCNLIRASSMVSENLH